MAKDDQFKCRTVQISGHNYEMTNCYLLLVRYGSGQGEIPILINPHRAKVLRRELDKVVPYEGGSSGNGSRELKPRNGKRKLKTRSS